MCEVRPQDDLSGKGQPIFDQHLVADSPPDIVEVLDALFLDKLADNTVVFGVLGGGGRGGVIQGDEVHIRIKDRFPTHLLEEPVDRGGVIVGQRHIGGHLDDLPGPGFC